MQRIERGPLNPTEVHELSHACEALEQRKGSRLAKIFGIGACVEGRAKRAAERALNHMQRSVLGESEYFDRRIPVWFMDHKASSYPMSTQDVCEDLYIQEHAALEAGQLARSAERVDLSDPELELADHHRAYLNHEIRLVAELGYGAAQPLGARDHFDRQMAVAVAAVVANRIVREAGELPARMHLADKVRAYLQDVYHCRQELLIPGLRPEGVMKFMDRLHAYPPGEG